MEKFLIRYIILFAILSLLSAIVNVLNYDVFAKSDDGLLAVKQIPESIGVWEGNDVHLDSSVYEILETKSIIHRIYTSSISAVFLSIVYYPDTKVDFHAPEACLGGSGNRLEKSPKTIQLNIDGKPFNLEINQLINKNIRYNELVYYFYKAGTYMGKSYFALRFNIAKNKLFNNNKSGALVRVSTVIPDNGDNNIEKSLKQFLEDLMPFLIRYL